MNISTNGDFNKVQINYSEDRTGTGELIKKGFLLTIREDSVEKAYSLFTSLQRKIEGQGEQPKKKVKKSQPNSEETAEKETPLCPIHQIPMLLKENKSNGNLFYGCPKWLPNRKGCNETLPYSVEKESKEDTVELEEIPF